MFHGVHNELYVDITSRPNNKHINMNFIHTIRLKFSLKFLVQFFLLHVQMLDCGFNLLALNGTTQCIKGNKKHNWASCFHVWASMVLQVAARSAVAGDDKCCN